MLRDNISKNLSEGVDVTEEEEDFARKAVTLACRASRAYKRVSNSLYVELHEYTSCTRGALAKLVTDNYMAICPNEGVESSDVVRVMLYVFFVRSGPLTL